MRLFGSLRRCKFPNQQLPNQQLPNQRQPRSLRLHFRLHLHLRRTAKKTPLMTGDVSHAACETAKMMATARCLGRFDSVPPVATLAVASSPNVCRRQQWLTTGLAAIPAAVNGAAKAFSFASSAVSQRARRCPHRPASAAAAAKRLATRSSSAPIAVPSAASGKHGRIARGRRCHWRMLTTGPAASAATSCPEALLPAQSAALAGSSRRGVARFCFGLSKSLVSETIGNGSEGPQRHASPTGRRWYHCTLRSACWPWGDPIATLSDKPCNALLSMYYFYYEPCTFFVLETFIFNYFMLISLRPGGGCGPKAQARL